MPLTVLLPKNEYSPALAEMLLPLLPAGSELADPESDLQDLHGRRLLFAVALDEGGCNEAYYRMLSRLRGRRGGHRRRGVLHQGRSP